MLDYFSFLAIPKLNKLPWKGKNYVNLKNLLDSFKSLIVLPSHRVKRSLFEAYPCSRYYNNDDSFQSMAVRKPCKVLNTHKLNQLVMGLVGTVPIYSCSIKNTDGNEQS
ncbi:neutral ceramidase [Platysternon megacephalum]|uniref:Neutral ceramidase n=1 Tax=Platysternon megacephalum TaxID=55544 RepID=A0A4D9EV11_9SAUR|nr:neutral ceramidase [Platysternon megacephalum]